MTRAIPGRTSREWSWEYFWTIVFLTVVLVGAAYMATPGLFRWEYRALAQLEVKPAERDAHLARLNSPELQQLLAENQRPGAAAPSRIAIGPGPTPQTIDIAVSAEAPETAMRAANTLAHLYSERRRSDELEKLRNDSQPLAQRAIQARLARARAEEQLAAVLRRPVPADLSTIWNLAPPRLRREVIAAREAEIAAQQKRDTISQSLSQADGGIISILEADRRSVEEPVQARFLKFRQNAIYFAVGLGVTLPIMVWGLMRIPGMRGRRLDTAQKASRELQLPIQEELPTPAAGAIALRSAYDRLFDSLISHSQERRRTIAVTSVQPGAGRSSVTANLALAIARRGYSVLVVDADLKQPAQHRLLRAQGGSTETGLLDLLVGATASPADVVRTTIVPEIRLLPIGRSMVTDLHALFGSRTMERFVTSIAPKLADVVLFDAPSVASDEPGLRLLPHVDGVICVVRLGETDTNRIKNGLQTLERMEVRVAGGVFVPAGRFSEAEAVPLPDPGADADPFAARPMAPVSEPAPSAIVPSAAPADVTPADAAHSDPSIVAGTPIAEDAVSETKSGEASADAAPAAALLDAETPATPAEEPTSAHHGQGEEQAIVETPDTIESTQSTQSAADLSGIEDLENVLQGWKRREPATTPHESVESPVALPPAVGGPAESAPGESAPTNGVYANHSHVNGTSTNGTSTNGTSTNGTSTNGASANGSHTSGAPTNGAYSGSATNGVSFSPPENAFPIPPPFDPTPMPASASYATEPVSAAASAETPTVESVEPTSSVDNGIGISLPAGLLGGAIPASLTASALPSPRTDTPAPTIVSLQGGVIGVPMPFATQYPSPAQQTAHPESAPPQVTAAQPATPAPAETVEPVNMFAPTPAETPIEALSTPQQLASQEPVNTVSEAPDAPISIAEPPVTESTVVVESLAAAEPVAEAPIAVDAVNAEPEASAFADTVAVDAVPTESSSAGVTSANAASVNSLNVDAAVDTAPITPIALDPIAAPAVVQDAAADAPEAVSDQEVTTDAIDSLLVAAAPAELPLIRDDFQATQENFVTPTDADTSSAAPAVAPGSPFAATPASNETLAPAPAWPMVAPAAMPAPTEQRPLQSAPAMTMPAAPAPTVQPLVTPPSSAPVPQQAAFSAPPMTAPVAAPTMTMPQAQSPSAREFGRPQPEVAIDMFPTAPGEMTLRATTTNAAAAGIPHVSLEMAVQMNAMRGMRAVPPTAGAGSDQPRIALEALAIDTPDALRMRAVAGASAEPLVEAIVRSGDALALRTGSGVDQPPLRIEHQAGPDGSSMVRITAVGTRDGRDIVMELRREAVHDGFSDARWRSRLVLFVREA